MKFEEMIMTRVSLVGIACVLSVASWAQTQQQARPQQQGNGTQAPRAAAASASQAQTAGSIKNDRNATIPRVGVSANPNAPSELVGCIAKNGSNYVLNQAQLSRSYQLRGNTGLITENDGRMVRVTGRLLFGSPAGFEVQQVQLIQPKCDYAQTGIVLPATGGAGAEGTALNTTTTATVGQTTPGLETEAGVNQNPSMTVPLRNFGAYTAPLAQRTSSQGAPPDPRYENPAEAERIANSATRSEMQNTRQLGVNAEPNYAGESNPQQTEQLTANEATQMRGQATDSTRVLQGGAGAAANSNREAQPSGVENASVFTGCVSQHDNQLMLVETATQQQFRLEGENLGQYVNQQVQIAGSLTGTYGPAVGTAGNGATVHVMTVRAQGSCTNR